MRVHTPPTCERCACYDSISNECREQSSIHYKGIVAHLHVLAMRSFPLPMYSSLLFAKSGTR